MWNIFIALSSIIQIENVMQKAMTTFYKLNSFCICRSTVGKRIYMNGN